MFNLFKRNKDKTTEYKFSDTKDTACFVCDHVLNKQKSILHVTHDYDGYWQFICGQNNHDETNGKIISIGQATKIDCTINDLFEMPLGFGADRKSINDKWEPYKIPIEKTEEIQEITLLTEQEFKSTFAGKMFDVTQTAESSVDIWPYVQSLIDDKIIDKDTFDNQNIEKIYRNQTNTFDQVLLPTSDKNTFIVIVVDLVKEKIIGHFRLDLNSEYGLK
jgi:hypothetical protein